MLLPGFLFFMWLHVSHAARRRPGSVGRPVWQGYQLSHARSHSECDGSGGARRSVEKLFYFPSIRFLLAVIAKSRLCRLALIVLVFRLDRVRALRSFAARRCERYSHSRAQGTDFVA